MRRFAGASCGLVCAACLTAQLRTEPPFVPQVPKAWNDAAKTYELPLSYGKPPEHISSAEYYAIPARTIFKSYPIYRPDREPAGYLQSLTSREPEIGFNPARLKTRRDWILAGAVVFESPNAILPLEAVPIRDPKLYREAGIPVSKDGVMPFFRYVIRKKGVIELAVDACAMCHTRVAPDGTLIAGVQGNFPFSAMEAYMSDRAVALGTVEPDETLRSAWRKEYAAPWAPQPELEWITQSQFAQLQAAIPAGVFQRHGTRPAYPVKIPDLIGVKDRRYLDATGLGQHRSMEDLIRYAITNQTTDRIANFNGFQPWPTEEWLQLTGGRYSDEQLYALALYIYSLEPPPNPNKFDALAARGQGVFSNQGCPVCHTPPLYTNNKLTPVEGFVVPEEYKNSYDILPIVVGTDPTSALTTRRGTGFYKVPSLKGVWYRGDRSSTTALSRRSRTGSSRRDYATIMCPRDSEATV